MRAVAIGFASLVAFASIGCDGASPARAQSRSETSSEQSADDPDKKSREASSENDESGGDETEAPGPSGDLDGGPPSAAVREGSPFSDYDLESLAEAWQGNWLLATKTGPPETAIKIDGGKAVQYEPGSGWTSGKKEFFETEDNPFEGQFKPHEFRIESPCSWVATREREEKGDHRFDTNFAFGEKHRFAGMGWGGVVTDQGAVACFTNKIYELTESGCLRWTKNGDEWEKEEAQCSLDEESFTVEETRETVDGEVTATRELERLGDVIVHPQLKAKEVQSFDTFEAAKRAAQ